MRDLTEGAGQPAVSGSNVAIVLGAALLVARRLRARPRAAATVAAVALVGFIVLARPEPSVLCAGVMGGVAILALASGRPWALLPALCAAVLLLLYVDPALSTAPGFALSVLPTAGLLLVAPGWRVRLARRLSGPLADAIAVPAATQVVCAPVIAALSAQVSLIAVPANLVGRARGRPGDRSRRVG